ncbi:MAG: cyclase family protein [Terriglobales bacterium]|jgi:kynurenine formamidase|nr:cyclase family protein [Terriglobales bacterium]
MRTKSLIVGYVLALALFLFGQRHFTVPPPAVFHTVVDLTYPTAAVVSAARNYGASTVLKSGTFAKASPHKSAETRLDAPAALGTGLWTADQIPPERLVAPLVVLDVRDGAKKNPNYQLSVIDIANWERIHGEVPPGSVVMALTGDTAQENYSGQDRAAGSAGYSADAAKFLIEGRDVVALGTDSGSVDAGVSRDRDKGKEADHPVAKYTLSRDAYLIENVADLDHAPADGGIVMVAPMKLENRAKAPVRILALAR